MLVGDTRFVFSGLCHGSYDLFSALTLLDECQKGPPTCKKNHFIYPLGGRQVSTQVHLKMVIRMVACVLLV